MENLATQYDWRVARIGICIRPLIVHIWQPNCRPKVNDIDRYGEWMVYEVFFCDFSNRNRIRPGEHVANRLIVYSPGSQGPVKAWGREFHITAKGCYLNLTSDQLMCWLMTAPKLHCAPSRGWHALPCHFNPGQAQFTPPDVTLSTKATGRGAKGGKYLVKEVLWTFLKYRRVYTRCETPMPPDAIFLSKTV